MIILKTAVEAGKKAQSNEGIAKLALNYYRISNYQGDGQNWNRTSDTRIFSPLLYRLSYLAK